MLRRLPRLLTLAAVAVSLAACAGSPTEPQAACARTSTSAAPSCPNADYANPKI